MGDLRTQPTEPFSSNALRLSGREWGAVAALVLVLVLLLPPLWKRLEPFTPSTDYRIPFQSSADYWLFERYGRAVAGRQRTLLIGDSVIWGQYVAADGTLSHHLNEQAGDERFANLGLDGTHPLALLGLYRDYGRTLEEEDVVLHLNLLWLSSPETDLRTDSLQSSPPDPPGPAPDPGLPGVPLGSDRYPGRAGPPGAPLVPAPAQRLLRRPRSPSLDP